MRMTAATQRIEFNENPIRATPMIVRIQPIRPVVVALIAHLAAVICAHSQTVSVDPSTPLQNYWGPEWNTDGGFESWTATKASVSLIFAPGSMLRFTYTRLKAATADVSFVVEWSDALANDWSTTAVSYDPPVEINAATESVTATLPAGSGSRRFARLRIIGP